MRPRTVATRPACARRRRPARIRMACPHQAGPPRPPCRLRKPRRSRHPAHPSPERRPCSGRRMDRLRPTVAQSRRHRRHTPRSVRTRALAGARPRAATRTSLPPHRAPARRPGARLAVRRRTRDRRRHRPRSRPQPGMGTPARSRSSTSRPCPARRLRMPDLRHVRGPRQEWVTIRPCPPCLIDLRRLDQRPTEAPENPSRNRSPGPRRAHPRRRAGTPLAGRSRRRAGTLGAGPSPSLTRRSHQCAAVSLQPRLRALVRAGDPCLESDGLTGRAQLALELDHHRTRRHLAQRPLERLGQLRRSGDPAISDPIPLRQLREVR